jgi:hypothetical protein
LKKLFFTFLVLLLFQANAYARSIFLTWDDNSADEQGFVVERTVSDNCVGGWEVIAYTNINQNYLEDMYIPGACYRVAAYNQAASSSYSNVARAPLN